MRTKMISVIVVCVLIGMTAAAFAVVPQTINYQGYLTDASGAPVNGTVSITFGLYAAPTGADAPLWTETQGTVTATNGLYSVALGSVTPLNLLFDQQYWLGVKVGGDAEMTPRQALASVPYAMRAASADTVTAGAIIDASIVDAKIASISASKVTGTIPVSQVAGAVSTAASNTFIGDQTINGNLNVTGAVAIGSGTPIAQHLSALATLTFPSAGSFACDAGRYVKIDGVADGDVVLLGLPTIAYSEMGVTYQGYVSTPGIVTVRRCTSNWASGSVTRNIRVDVWKHTAAIDGTMPIVVTANKSVVDIGSVKVNLPNTYNFYQYGNFSLTAGTMNNVDVVVSSATITGDASFSINGGCTAGSHIAPGASCMTSIMFLPYSAGTHTATATVQTNGGSFSVTVTGTGTVTPEFQWYVLQMMYPDFGYSQVGTTSATSPIMVEVYNSGSADLIINSANSNLADFTISSNGCTAPVPPQGSCRLGISFKPAATGSRSGTLTVTANDANSPHTMMLSGTGGTLPAFATAETSTTNLDFGSLLTGQTGDLFTFGLSNNGNVPLIVSDMAVSNPEFWVNSGCYSVAPGTTCTVYMSFHPAGAGGTRIATLTITDNASGSPQTVTLTAKATAPVVQLSDVDFGSVVQGASVGQNITVNNSGDGILLVSSITITGDYTFTSNCMAGAVAPGQSCQITVTARPATLGSRPGMLTLTDNAGTGTQTAAFSMNGIAGQSLTVTPASIQFTNTYSSYWHQWGGFQTVTITVAASGTEASTNVVFVLNPYVSDAFSVQYDSTCPVGSFLAPSAPITLEAGTSCIIRMNYNNQAIGTSHNGSLYVTSDGGNASVWLSGVANIN